MKNLKMSREQFIFMLGSLLATIKAFTEQYVFCDWEFLIFLAVLFMMDLILGVWKHIILETISSSGFGQCLKKFIIYSMALILSHVMASYTVSGQQNIIFKWIPNLIYSVLVLKESISILENMGVIYPNLIPSWILKKLKEYDKSGKFSNKRNYNGSYKTETKTMS